MENSSGCPVGQSGGAVGVRRGGGTEVYFGFFKEVIKARTGGKFWHLRVQWGKVSTCPPAALNHGEKRKQLRGKTYPVWGLKKKKKSMETYLSCFFLR